MNLIYDSWIPVKKRNGEKVKISPCEITENISTDLEYTDISSVRPDFDGALIQFLIGLLQTTCAPQNTQEWFSWFNKPPDKEELKKKFNPIAQYFNLDGNGPRFMQETTLQFNKNVIAEGLPISKCLLICQEKILLKTIWIFLLRKVIFLISVLPVALLRCLRCRLMHLQGDRDILQVCVEEVL